jgi:uroporphyrin-III C-methyltransferase
VEVVPGISTGFAAAALAGLSLTGRITSSRLLFATRHLAAGATNGLEGITPDTSLVLYMPGKDYVAIASELAANGWPSDTRCIIASALGTAGQQWKECLLSGLAMLDHLPAPVVMLFVPAEKYAANASGN